MPRDQLISQIRPVLDLQEANSPSEIFQNKTLRPIIKFQNELLLSVFRAYLAKRKDAFYKGSDQEKRIYIENAVKKDMKFKHYLEGLISGHFTSLEYEDFLVNEEELTKRMINLVIQRLQSQLALL
jgi:hypothetical protein